MTDSITLQFVAGDDVFHEVRLPIKNGVYQADVTVERNVPSPGGSLSFRYIDDRDGVMLFEQYDQGSIDDVAIFEAKQGDPVFLLEEAQPRVLPPLSNAELDDLDRIEKAATPGPWELKGDWPDWRLAAVARNALPRLIDEVRQHRKINDERARRKACC